MKRSFILSAFILILMFPGLAQNNIPFTIPCSARVNMSTVTDEWNPVVQTIEMPVPGGVGNRLKAVKEYLAKKYPRKTNRQEIPGTMGRIDTVSPPYIGHNFPGNTYNNSTPCDNDVAVSNGGRLVSVQNSNIYRYDISTWNPAGQIALTSFFNALGNSASKYDPKVLYDPEADRFILLCLAGYAPASTNILLAFSQTNDPSGLWNLYSLPGNPLNDTLWTDFPMIQLTHGELFITVNHLHDNMSWQLGWVRTVIWQLKKSEGYNALTLNAVLHSDIGFNGKKIRNLCPVRGDSQLYGPDMYFLSNRNLDTINDTIFLVHLTDTINAPNFQINVTALQSDIAYLAPPNALQPPSTNNKLATNDARVLGAIMGLGKIQYVQNTMDTINGTAAIIHGIISNPGTNPAINAHLISDTLLEFAYPNLSYAGTDSTDQTTFISFLHSGATVYPGFSVRTWNGSEYSPILKVKNGDSYINVLSGDDRWGDYSGSQRVYDKPGEVWLTGMYGRTNHQHGTWVAHIGTSITVNVAPPLMPETEVQAFPNPFAGQFEVLFILDKPEILKFELSDLSGRNIKLLLHDRVKAGTNRFSFSGNGMAPGTYILKIYSEDRTVAAKKIIKT